MIKIEFIIKEVKKKTSLSCNNNNKSRNVKIFTTFKIFFITFII
jgi:hypothetical protein